MKNIRFLKNAAIMVVSSFLLRFCGMWFRVYLAGQIGASGMGLYQLIFSVFTAGVAMSTSGMFLVSTRFTSENDGGGTPDKIRMSLIKCITYGVSLSLCAAGALFLLSDTISRNLLGDENTASALRILACGLPFMSCCACFRGYFVAERNTLQPSVAEVAEQLITVIVPVAAMVQSRSIYESINIIMLGSTLGEIASCTYMFAAYKRAVKKRRLSLKSKAGKLSQIVRIAFPSTIASTARNLLGTAENLLIPFGLKKSGLSKKLSLEKYGIMQGMAFPALIFPSAVIIPFSSILVPEVARARAAKDKEGIKEYIAFSLRFSLRFSIFIACIFFTFGKEISLSLFKSESGGEYMRILSPIIPLIYTDNAVDGLLKGLDKQFSSCIFNLIDGGMRILLLLVLLPKYRIDGYICILFASALLNGFLSLRKLIKTADFSFPVFKFVISPLALSAFSILLCKILPFGFIIRIAVAGVSYFLFLLLDNKLENYFSR